MAKEKPCANCKLRAKYDNNPRSLMGRFWRWHINFCPGWKGYIASLSDNDYKAVCEKYDLHK